jgi:hypothetical protein
MSENIAVPNERTQARKSQDIRVNYEEVGNLMGHLLTLADATFGDTQQRKAQKDMLRATVYGWVEDQYQEQYDDYEPSGLHSV